MANSHTKAVNKYNAANYDSLRIVVPKGQKEKIKAHAEKRGESINGFVGRAINETLQRDEKDVLRANGRQEEKSLARYKMRSV